MVVTGMKLRAAAVSPEARSELRALVALTIASMVGFRLIVAIHDVLDEEFQLKLVLPFEIAVFTTGLLICTAIYLVLRRVRRSAPIKQLLIAVLTSLVGSTILGFSVGLACSTFMEVCPKFTPDFLLLHVLTFFPAFAIWSAMSLTIGYYREVRERERRLALLQVQSRDAQMRALRYQVNPHLLYNTLNSIAALILDRKNALAEQMVMRLSDFFRASLASDPHSDVPLADEVALQRLYLEIEQMRFPDRLSSEFDIPRDLEQVRVPSLILQPLIENALKHAVGQSGSPTQVQVRARQRNAELILEVSDNGPGQSAVTGTGIGLKNVRDRLHARFGGDADLETESDAGSGFLVRLKIPVVMRAEDYISGSRGARTDCRYFESAAPNSA